MSLRIRTIRLLLLVAAGLVVAVGLGVRRLSDGPVGQHSGTALYACLVYVGTLFARPGSRPLTAGAVALGFCWLVESFQLTGIPADLSAHSTLARLALGSRFDPADLAWYAAGVGPLVALHALVRARVEVEHPVQRPARPGSTRTQAAP